MCRHVVAIPTGHDRRIRGSARGEIDRTGEADPDGGDVGLRAAELDLKALADATLAKNIAAALQADFRKDKTREYFGSVRGIRGTTVVTICDAQHFVVEDEDRILDGEFTVLAKVSARSERNVPVFERNKVLRNLNPDAGDIVIDGLLSQLRASNSTTIGGQHVEELLDFDLSSRISGAALRVIPIAIYV